MQEYNVHFITTDNRSGRKDKCMLPDTIEAENMQAAITEALQAITEVFDYHLVKYNVVQTLQALRVYKIGVGCEPVPAQLIFTIDNLKLVEA